MSSTAGPPRIDSSDSSSSTNAAANPPTNASPSAKAAPPPPRPSTRDEQELALTALFQRVIHGHTRLLQDPQKYAPGSNIPPGSFTPLEESVLLGAGRYNNYTAGAVAAAGTVGVLYGLLQWRAGRFSSSHVPLRQVSMHTSHVKQHYAQLDRPSAIRAPPSKSNPNRVSPTPPSFTSNTTPSDVTSMTNSLSPRAHLALWRSRPDLQDEIFQQVQWIALTGIGLMVCAYVSSKYTRDDEYTLQLSTLPLQPGRSLWCHQVCPSVLYLHELLMKQQQQSKQNSTTDSDNTFMTNDTGDTATTTASSSSSSSPSSTANVPDLLQHPHNVNLHHMMKFVYNCRQRQTMSRDILLQQGGEAALSKYEPVDIPEPGVPWNYLGVAVPEGTEEDIEQQQHPSSGASS
jgi:hypothetical protein